MLGYDDLFSLEVALIKATNALSHNAPRPVADLTASETTQRVQLQPVQPVPRPARATADDLPDFDPTGRPAPVRPPATERPTAASATPAEPIPPSTPAAAERPKASWHTVQSRAGTQLKAFMLPAKADIDGSDIFLRFADTHKFHFTQLKNRQDELTTLVKDVLGEGYTLHLEGPGERLTKKS